MSWLARYRFNLYVLNSVWIFPSLSIILDSIQIMRRLRAMLENLIDTLPARRAPLLRQELRLLESSAKRMFPDLDDQTLAETVDLQGMGGGDGESHRLSNEPLVHDPIGVGKVF